MRTARTLAAAAAMACIAGISANTGFAASEVKGAAVLAQIATGGYVIYQRHSLTDTAHGDADPVNLEDCATQRPLSEAGRVLARKIGAAFRATHIPVDRVVSSPLCRAAETAALEFPTLPRSTANALWYSLALTKDQAEQIAVEVKRMLATPPPDGTNTVIVGHSSNLQEATGIWPKKEGGAVVFRPDGQGGFTVVGSIDPADFENAAN